MSDDPTTDRAQRQRDVEEGRADDAVDRQSPRSEGGVRGGQTGPQTGDQPTREEVAADLDIDPSGVGAIDRQDGRDLFLRSEGVEDVRQTTTERFVEQADFIAEQDVAVDVDAQDITADARVAEDRRDAVADRAREQTAADAAVVEPDDLDAEVGARGVEDLRIREDRRDAVGERARERTAADSDLIQADDLTAEVGDRGVEDVFIAEDRRDVVGERARERAADGRFVEPGDFRAEVGATGVESVELREGADDRIERRQRDALREDVAADAGVDPSEVEIDRTDDGFEATVPGDPPDEDEIRDELRSDAAAEFDDFGESDILIDQDGDEFTARVDPDAQREQAAESIEADLREEIRDDAPDFLQDFAAIGDDPTRVGPRGLREAMDQFQSGEIDVEQLRDVSDARVSDAAIPTAEGILGDGLDADDIEETDDGFALGSDVQQRAATVGIDAEVDADRIGEDDVVLRDGQAELTDDAQRRVARIDAADEFEDFDADDLEVAETDDGELQVGVSPAAQRDRILDEVGPSAFVVDGGGGEAFDAALSLRGRLEGIATRDDISVALEESGSDARTTDPIADIIEGLDPETAEQFDVLDADEVRAAQQDIETTRQDAQRDPEAFVDSLDEIDLTDALEFDESARRGQRRRSELRDQADGIEEDIAADQTGIEADDVDLRVDGEGGLTLRDDSAETIERAAAAEDLGVERDQVVETGDGFGVDPDVVEAELRSDFASEAGVDTDDVVVDREADGFEARLADDVLGERQAEAIAADQAGVDADQVDVAVDDGQIDDVAFSDQGRIDATAAATDGVSADDLTLRDGDVELLDRSAAVPGDVARFGSPQVDDRTLADIFAEEDEEDEEELPVGDDVTGAADVDQLVQGPTGEATPFDVEDVDLGFGDDDTDSAVDAIPFAGAQFGADTAGEMIGADDVTEAASREAAEFTGALSDAVDSVPGSGEQLGADDLREAAPDVGGTFGDAEPVRDALQDAGQTFDERVTEPTADAAVAASPVAEADRVLPGTPVSDTVRGVTAGAVGAANIPALADTLIGTGERVAGDTGRVAAGDADDVAADAQEDVTSGAVAAAGAFRADPFETGGQVAGAAIGGTAIATGAVRGAQRVRSGSRTDSGETGGLGDLGSAVDLEDFRGDTRAQAGFGRQRQDTDTPEQEAVTIERGADEVTDQADRVLGETPGVTVQRGQQDLESTLRQMADEADTGRQRTPRQRAEDRVPGQQAFESPQARQREISRLEQRFREQDMSDLDGRAIPRTGGVTETTAGQFGLGERVAGGFGGAATTTQAFGSPAPGGVEAEPEATVPAGEGVVGGVSPTEGATGDAATPAVGTEPAQPSGALEPAQPDQTTPPSLAEPDAPAAISDPGAPSATAEPRSISEPTATTTPDTTGVESLTDPGATTEPTQPTGVEPIADQGVTGEPIDAMPTTEPTQPAATAGPTATPEAGPDTTTRTSQSFADTQVTAQTADQTLQLGQAQQAALDTQGVSLSARTTRGSRRAPPRPRFEEPMGDTDDPEAFGFETDDDVFGSGILGGEEAVEDAFGR